VIKELLPPAVMAEEAFGDVPTELFPEEAALLSRAVDKRRREFTTVRACARAALARLGVAPAPILPGLRGAPGWPEGVVGSMTHCAGYRAAAVARGGGVWTIGIDAEPNETLPDGVLEVVSREEERAWLRGLMAADSAVHWDRLLFSAKESVYKAWFPLTGRWLGFEDATITVDPGKQTFAATLLVTTPPAGGRPLTGFTGRWLSRDGLILTAIVGMNGA
jgi:4'-phosphopantetheinyl transferase EntD